MAELVYILCALTSATCALLLFRSYRQNRARLLLWSTFCFVMFTLNNVVLFFDLIVIPDTDLSVVRALLSSAGLGGLLFGLVWDTK
jgi:hypothetical protein